MPHVTIYLLFISLTLALCSPVNQENCSENIVELNATESEEGIDDVNGNTTKPSRSCTTNVLEDNLSPSSSQSQEHEPQNLPDIGKEYRHVLLNVGPAYQSDTSGNLKSMGVEVSNSRGVLYPHVHSKLFAMYNAGYNVNYLPPVHSTYIHGLVPEEDLQKANYELDVLTSQNAMFTPEQIRMTRMIHSQDEEILAQLQHDAIMKNILPMMPVPSARLAAASTSPSSTYSYDSAPAIAVFPYGAGGGCAQPILLSCSPKITSGTLQPLAPIKSAVATSPIASSAYRQPATDHESKSDHKQSSPGKVNLSS
ncbi:uncharacterized protein LOC113237214 [Hyposmocoma kahamanoa]|uniref:uncharacterized protein LOC113237214 n=1 Tax=Hyposmocoma kahamanoa TaxID=1477025 RepID=UPI000E6D91C5|nr:uncharacterized protein LOC113237214 [Hyposmocoma kahamanoa]